MNKTKFTLGRYPFPVFFATNCITVQVKPGFISEETPVQQILFYSVKNSARTGYNQLQVAVSPAVLQTIRMQVDILFQNPVTNAGRQLNLL
jgi:hypothetical protein